MFPKTFAGRVIPLLCIGLSCSAFACTGGDDSSDSDSEGQQISADELVTLGDRTVEDEAGNRFYQTAYDNALRPLVTVSDDDLNKMIAAPAVMGTEEPDNLHTDVFIPAPKGRDTTRVMLDELGFVT